MSPRELYREMEAAKGRQQDAIDARLHLAWQTVQYAALAMVGKLPSLTSVLGKAQVVNSQTPVQTKAQMATVVRMLAAQYGYPVRRIES